MARRKAARVRSKKPAGKPARRRRRRRAPPVRVSEASLAAYAHDIRTALTGILALGELLASSNLGERERRWAFSIKGSAEHLAALTSLMIDAAKADAGALRLQEEVFRPRRLIEVLGEFARRAGGDQGPRRRGDRRGRCAGALGRRRGTAAGGAGKPHRQCGEVHRARRRAARCARGTRDARPRAAGLHRHRQRHRAQARRDQAAVPAVRPSQARRLRGAMAAQASGLPSSNIWPS